MVISQFIKGRFDEFGDNRKGFFEEGMTKQKSEEIAFKQAKKAEKRLPGRMACAKSLW